MSAVMAGSVACWDRLFALCVVHTWAWKVARDHKREGQRGTVICDLSLSLPLSLSPSLWAVKIHSALALHPVHLVFFVCYSYNIFDFFWHLRVHPPSLFCSNGSHQDKFDGPPGHTHWQATGLSRCLLLFCHWFKKVNKKGVRVQEHIKVERSSQVWSECLHKEQS